MRNILTMAITISILLLACSKSNLKPSQASNVTNEQSLILKSNFDLLTAHTWVYNKYYINYVDSTNLGTLAYKRGRTINTINLNQNSVTFNVDGTVTEIDENGASVPGKWHFTNSEQTAYVVINAYGKFPTKIVLLNNLHFHWVAPKVNRYAEMVPSN